MIPTMTSDTLIIAAVGDMFMNPHTVELALSKNWPEITQAALGYDLGIANFEGSLFVTSSPRKQVLLHMTGNAPQVLKAARITVVNLANNHIGDGGEGSISKTRHRLEEEGIICFGAGRNEKEARMPALVQMSGLEIGILGYCSTERYVGGFPASPNREGVAPINGKIILEDVRNLKKSVDRVIVYLHWGKEYRRFPRIDEQILANRIIEAGADVLLGGHPHVPRPFDSGRRIAFSLGNFMFPEVVTQDGRRLRWDRISKTSIAAILHISKSDCIMRTRALHIDQDGLPWIEPPVSRFRAWLAGATEHKPVSSSMHYAQVAADELFWLLRRPTLWRQGEWRTLLRRRLRNDQHINR